MRYGELRKHSGLFGDWLEDVPSVRTFLPLRPGPAALRERAAGLMGRQFRRTEMHRLLTRQAAECGAGKPAIESIDRLVSDRCAVVLASLPASFAGGPLSVLLKCLTAAKIAAETEQAGIPSVPVCWLSPEAEGEMTSTQITMLDRAGELRKVEIRPTRTGAVSEVGDLVITNEIDACLSYMETSLGLNLEDSILLDLKNSFAPGTPYRLACRRFISTLVGDFGVVLFDAREPEFKTLALQALSESQFSFEQATFLFCRQAKFLREAGYCGQWGEGGGGQEACPDDLQPADPFSHLNEESAGRVSSGPYLQLFLEAILPVAAHVVDPKEVCAFALAAPVLREFGLAAPLVWPRASATISDPRSRKIMAKYGIGLADLFAGKSCLLRELSRETSAEEVVARLQGLENLVENALLDVRSTLPNGAGAEDIAGEARSKMLFQLEKLRERFETATNQRREAIARQVERLCNSLLPKGYLQEEVIAGLHFLLHHSSDFLNRLYGELDTQPFTHQLISAE